MNNIVPDVIFKTRVRDETIEGDNPYKWKDKTSDEYFKGRKVILFSLTGAFTPTCSTYQLPNFEKLFYEFKSLLKSFSCNFVYFSNRFSKVFLRLK